MIILIYDNILIGFENWIALQIYILIIQFSKLFTMIKSHFKQEYLYNQMPFKTDFFRERTIVFAQILSFLKKVRINSWGPEGLDFLFLIQRFKIVYGLQAEEKQLLLTLFCNMLFTGEKYAIQTRAYILKTLNYLLSIKTKINNFKINNILLLDEYRRLATTVLIVPMKHLQSYIEQLNYFTKLVCSYGEDTLLQALDLAIEQKQLRYLSLLVRSAKNIQHAQKIVEQLFCLSGVWERDYHWFYILSQITKKFPQLSFEQYFHTLFQEIIKNFNAILNPISDQDTERVILADEFTNIPSIFKSMALILTNLIVPKSQTHCDQIWLYIQRIFTMIISIIDPHNQQPQIIELIKFIRIFIKNFLRRLKKQKNQNFNVNEDYVQEQQGVINSDIKQEFRLDNHCISNFTRLCKLLIPKILYIEENGCKIPKIILQLITFDQQFIDQVLTESYNLLYKEDEISLFTTKMVLLFISEHIITYTPHKISQVIKCIKRMIEVIYKLGISDHLDMVQLIIRMLIYFPKQTADLDQVKDDLLDLIIQNLDTISIILQNSDNSQAQIYIDIKNIFFPLFLSLEMSKLQKFIERFIYKTVNMIPQHTESYELILIIFSYILEEFPSMIIPKFLKNILKPIKSEKYFLLPELQSSLQTENEEYIKWYCMVIECTYQYQPLNVMRDFNLLQPIIINMMKSENSVIFESGCDILHNLVICLATNHINYREFQKFQNGKYQTMNLKWQQMTPQILSFLQKIIKKYLYDTIDFVLNRYQHVKQSYNTTELLDSILIPTTVGHSTLQEKKLLTKILSIQQCVVSAILPKVTLTSKLNSPILQILKPHTFECFNNIRQDIVKYLNKIIAIMHEVQIISEPALIKIFYIFYNQIHGQSYISQLLQPTQEKLSAYITETVFQPKLLLNSSFLLINQVILIYYLKIDLLTALYPTAQVINPLYMQQLMILSHHSSLTISNRAFFDCSEQEFHSYHRKILEIWWEKLDYTSPKSYFKRLENKQLNENKRQRYKHAINTLVQCLKKIATYLTMECCVQDNILRKILFGFAKIYNHLEKKKQKLSLLQTLFTLFSFQFDNTLIIAEKQYNVWQRQNLLNKFAVLVGNQLYIKEILSKPMKPIQFHKKQQNNKFTYETLEQIIKQSLAVLKNKTSKQHVLYALYSIIYLPFIKNNNPIITEVFLMFEKLAKRTESELSQMGRIGIFHIINRFRKIHTKTNIVKNTPKKIPFQIFMKYRSFGCPEEIDPQDTSCKKYENTFHVSKTLKHKITNPLSDCQRNVNEDAILNFLTDENRLTQYFISCFNDKQLMDEPDEQYDLNKIESKGVIMQCQRLLNYLLDRDPKKINIFSSFIDNFSLYTLSFYPRFIKKILQVGGGTAAKTLESVALNLLKKQENEAKKLYSYISLSILLHDPSQSFLNTYLTEICTCSNDLFIIHLGGLYYLFRRNPFTVKKIYKSIIDKLRAQKGSSRLRHIELWKIFVIGQGRWGREQAVQGLEWLLKGGINQASQQIAEAIVTAIVECFTLPLNLTIFKDWVQQPIYELVKNKKLFKFNEEIGFQMHPKLSEIFSLITNKIQQEKEYESSSLKIYTKVASRILQNLTVYQFNDFFYEMLTGIINHLIYKSLDDINQSDILRRLGESQYPITIYQKLIPILQNLNGIPLVTVKKKLKFLETLMFCNGFVANKINLPNIFDNQSSITIYHIHSIANILKVMTMDELTIQVNTLLKMSQNKKYAFLMGCLLASGNIAYQWKQEVLKNILSWKMKKLIKQFVSCWWKGKGEGYDGEEGLARLVKNVENPYNYFA